MSKKVLIVWCYLKCLHSSYWHWRSWFDSSYFCFCVSQVVNRSCFIFLITVWNTEKLIDWLVGIYYDSSSVRQGIVLLPGTRTWVFCSLDRCANHYTTSSMLREQRKYGEVTQGSAIEIRCVSYSRINIVWLSVDKTSENKF